MLLPQHKYFLNTLDQSIEGNFKLNLPCDMVSVLMNPHVGGYFVGSETYIPALDYFTAIDEAVDWEYAFERQWLFYKLLGRVYGFGQGVYGLHNDRPPYRPAAAGSGLCFRKRIYGGPVIRPAAMKEMIRTFFTGKL